jgi:hypothetical protein
MSKKTHEELLNISGHKGNANQNCIEISPHLLRLTTFEVILSQK